MAWWPPREWFARWRRSRGAGKQWAYAGAAQSRRTYDMDASDVAANVELGSALPTLRLRTRKAMRDNAYARHSLSQLASYASGIMPRSAIPVPDGASDLTRRRIERENGIVDAVHEEWAKVCGIRGGANYRGLQFQAVLGMLVSGESFTRERGRPLSAGLPVPLQIEVMEADLCDHTRNENPLTSGGWIRQGVEHDSRGAVVGYWMYRQHPKELSIGVDLNTAFETVRVPAREVAHLYPELFGRPGQVRGEPWFCANIQPSHDFWGYLDAERVRLRAAASQMTAVKSTNEFRFPGENPEEAYGLSPVRDSSGQVVERMRSGQIIYLQDGQDVVWNKPPISDGFQSYVKTDLHAQAAGVLMPYELYTGDLADTSYSSIRFGLNSFSRLIAGRLAMDAVVPRWAEVVWAWFIRAGVASGTLPRSAGPVAWEPEPMSALEPDREAKANATLVRHGAKSLLRWIRETGCRPEDVLRDTVTLHAWSKEHGIPLDSFPWATAQDGDLQGGFIVDPESVTE